MQNKPVHITHYENRYASQVVACFLNSVQMISDAFYNQDQCNAWSASAADMPWWQERLINKQPYLAIQSGVLAGFIELDANGHIDGLYVHPVYQRQHVATALYQYAENTALAKHMPRLFVEASYVAKPFFEKQGFVILRKNENIRGGQMLLNFFMEKILVCSKPLGLG